MYKQKFIQFIASFLIVLVLTIPLYTTSVYATINRVSAKGNDGIEGYIKQKDMITYTADVFIEGDTITNDQVVLGQNIKFDNCNPSIDKGYICTLKYPKALQTFEPTAHPFTVNLFKDDKTLDSSKSGTVIVDNKAPEVKLSINKNKFSSQEEAVISYEVADFAFDKSEDKCAGIKSIEFYNFDGSFKQTIEPETNDCKIESSLNVNLATFKDGINSIFGEATDRLSQKSAAKSVTFDVDAIGPVILADAFAILRKGLSISTFSKNKVNVDVFVNISERELNLDSVTADLTALGGLKDAKADCTNVEEDKNVCKWGIEFNPVTEGVKSIAISAADELGNKASTTINKQLSLDESLAVQSLATSTAKDDKSYGKPTGNKVIAVFEEATGLASEDIFLYLNGVKLKAADNCIKENNWICVWENVNFGDTATISIETDTKDILGNPVAQRKSVEVILDKEAPVLKGSIRIESAEGLTEPILGFFKIGDRIFVEANVTDENSVTATADFSKFITDATKVSGSCEIVEGKYKCTWITDKINLAAKGNAVFTFTDAAGNSLIEPKQIQTFGLETAEVPDFWKHEVECSPKTFDRELGTLTKQRAYCVVKLSTKTTKQVSPVFISQPECLSKPQVLGKAELFNVQPSKSPIIKLTLKEKELRTDEINVSCSIDIFSKIERENTITRNPEIENVDIQIGLYNLPLGELGDEVNRKIKDAKKDAQGIFKTVGTMNKWVNVAKRICQAIHTIFSVVAIFFILTIGFKKTEQKCHESGILEATGACAILYGIGVGQCGATEGSSTAADKSKSTLNKFCDFVTCKNAPLWGDDVQRWINNLPLAGYIGPTEDGSSTYYDFLRDTRYGLRPLSNYMDPNNNLVVATLFACLPGMVYGLDKMRQIQCLYADCLENAVRDGLPVTACEDQKYYATCKYVTGELFAIIPYTAVFDHFTSIIKEALSNPFTSLGVAVSLYCGSACPVPADGGFKYNLCRGARLAALVGDAAENVAFLGREGFKIRQDYCSRIDFSDLEEEEESEESA